MPRMNELLSEITSELASAEAKFGPFNSAHEGWAVILEEVEELWAEVTQKTQSKERMREEAIQIAAMAIRFIRDCTVDADAMLAEREAGE